MSTTVPYQLSCEVFGHEAAVRCIAPLPKGKFCTGSRDNTVRVWKRGGDGLGYVQQTVLRAHQNFVSVVHAPPIDLSKVCSQLPPHAVLSAGFDKCIFIWSVQDDTETQTEPYGTLVGHEKVVCCLDVCNRTGDIVSGSWDHTAKVWRDGKCVQTLEGHEHPVWAVLFLDDGDLVTASADKSIRFWKDGECTKTVKNAHNDCIRSLVRVPGVGFLSCSNDTTVKLWTATGEFVRQYFGHTNLVYCVEKAEVNGAMVVISTGEDRTMRVWDGSSGDELQEELHPSVVWAATVLDNGDVATAGSDGFVRVWTTAEERTASADVREAYLAQVQASKNKAIDESNVKGPEALNEAGTKDGEAIMVRMGDKINVYQWSVASKNWVHAGEATGGVDTGPSTATLNGKTYDQVFTLEVSDRSIKFGFNNSDSPYMVAQQLIWDEELSQDNLDTIANWITKNAGPVVISQGGGGGEYRGDPLTGGCGYHGGGGSPAPTNNGGYQGDPLTGAGGYHGGGGGHHAPPPPAAQYQQTNADPLTGGSSYSTSTLSANSSSQSTASNVPEAAPVEKSPYTSFPVYGPLLFESSNYVAMRKKTMTFNETVRQREEAAKFAMTAADQATYDSAINVLKETSYYHSSTLDSKAFDLIGKCLLWPSDLVFPILDLVRLLLLHPAASEHYGSGLPATVFDEGSDEVVDIVKAILRIGFTSPSPSTPCTLLGARVLVNMFSRKDAREFVIGAREQVLDAVAEFVSSTNKNIRLSIVTLILNFSTECPKGGSSLDECRAQCLSLLSEIVSSESDDEVLYRALVSVGNLVYKSDNGKQLATDLDLVSSLTTLTTEKKDVVAAKVLTCASEVTKALLA